MVCNALSSIYNFLYSVVFGLITIAAQENQGAEIVLLGFPVRMSFLPFASLLLSSFLIANASFIVCYPF